MSVVARQHHLFSFVEYLSLEKESTLRHEFVDGVIVAMAGGSPEHNAACVNVVAAMLSALRDRACRVHSADQRIRMPSGKATYPDATVFCDRVMRDPEDASGNTATNPVVVVEVLSRSTAAYDRGDKLDQYRAMPSVEAVILVDHEAVALAVWERDSEGNWSVVTRGAGEVATLSSLGLSLSVDDVYRDGLTGGVLAPW